MESEHIPEVVPFKVDEIHVFIRCPYCSKVHVHGSAGGRYWGHRASHCDFNHYSNAGYTIVKLEEE